jgi:hypothetical protein
MDIERFMNDEITVRGTAFDAHAGAVVVTDDGDQMFIEELPYWSKQDRGKGVEVTGTLRSQKLAPDATVDADGVPSQGMMGSQLILERATWRVLPDS